MYVCRYVCTYVCTYCVGVHVFLCMHVGMFVYCMPGIVNSFSWRGVV